MNDKPVIALGSEKHVKRNVYVVVCEATDKSRPKDCKKVKLNDGYRDAEYDLSTIRQYSVGIPVVSTEEFFRRLPKKAVYFLLGVIAAWLPIMILLALIVFGGMSLRNNMGQSVVVYGSLAISLIIVYILILIIRQETRIDEDKSTIRKESKEWDKDNEHLCSLLPLHWAVFSASEWEAAIALTSSRHLPSLNTNCSSCGYTMVPQVVEESILPETPENSNGAVTGRATTNYGLFRYPDNCGFDWLTTACHIYGRKIEWAFTHKDDHSFTLCVECGSVPTRAASQYPSTAKKRVGDCSHCQHLLKPKVWAMDTTGHAFIVTYEQCVVCNTLVAARTTDHCCPICGNRMGCIIIGKGYNGKSVSVLVLR
jgi:hypothetical protein